jgi:hypothetical protein
MKRLLGSLIAGFLAAATQALAGALQPGVYDELLIGYAPATGVVSGYFQTETGGGQFSCIFTLSGTFKNGAARITTYFPEAPKDRIAGTLFARGGEVEIVLDNEPGGCGMAQPFADKARAAAFSLAAAHPWTAIRVVRVKKAYFYNAPGDGVHRKGYMVQGDGVGVRAISPGWVQVDYPNPDKMVSGWVREADLYPPP